MAYTSQVRGRGQVTVPAEVREALHIQEGDTLEWEVAEPGVVQVRAVRMVPVDQAWFWTPGWQKGEREASEDIAAGRLSPVYKDIADMFDDMDAGR